jgi:hypothetical protein
MANPSAAEMLFRIAADPSKAEENVTQFHASASRELTGLSSDLTRWLTQGSEQFNLAGRAVDGFSQHFTNAFSSADRALEQNRVSAGQWRVEILEHLSAVGQTSQVLQSDLMRTFVQFDTALAHNVTTALIWQKSMGQAFRQAAVEAIAALAQEAIVCAIFSAAMGFLLLAEQNYSGAAQAFLAAAEFGAVGGAAALAGRALEGGGTQSASGGSAQSSGTSARTRGGSSSRTRGAQGSGQQTVQVIFQGPIYGGQAGIDELTRKISQAVVERDVNLTAYTVVRQPATRA